LKLSTSELNFGGVATGQLLAIPITLISVGTAPVQVSSPSILGTAFSISGLAFPITLNPGGAIRLDVQFKPQSAGAQSGTITFLAGGNNAAALTVSGTGTISAPPSVVLNWNSPATSPLPVSGYNIYRSGSGGPPKLLNATPQTGTTFLDQTVRAGATYTYYVESVADNETKSVPSNPVTVDVPMPPSQLPGPIPLEAHPR
jgi:hypothetical protein